MPKQDGTGPNGNGPATGRGLGNCKPRGGANTPNQPNQQPFSYNGPYGRGFGRGRGLGKGGGRGQGYRGPGRP